MNKSQITIVALSDLHGSIPANVPECDVLCIAGDIVPLEYQSDYEASISWLSREFFPWCTRLIDKDIVKKVCFTPGNHDFVFECLQFPTGKAPRPIRNISRKLIIPHGVHLLIDSGIDYMGYVIWGSPWCPELSNWAYYADSEGLTEKFNQIPNRCDVLITHCAPRVGEFGTTHEGWNYGRNFGCRELAQVIERKQPRLCVFGHIHTGQHKREMFGDSMLANVSIKNEDYLISYDPQVFVLSNDQVR